jgi:hypothetical protein
MNTQNKEYPRGNGTSGVGGIRVDTGSGSADWARWCSRERRSMLAALDIGGQPQMAFVPDEVLVDTEDDPNLVRDLVERFGAEILKPPAIPFPPNGLGPAREVNAEAMPMPTHLRFRVPPLASAHGAAVFREAYGDSASVTSEMAAGVLGLVVQLASEGRSIGINVVGRAAQLSLLTVAEATAAPQGADPFQWPAYAGRARVPMAWQLIEAYRKLASIKSLVTVAVLDGGFWLNGKTPAFPGGQPSSDFGTFVFQLNLLDESVGAGGANPNKCNGGYTCPWHGNAVASVAVAPVGNGLGSAGAGGTVARPVFFKSDLSVDQIFRCLQVCLAWGVDVLNMSFSKTSWELAFPTSSWNRAFQFAADNGLIMVAAAGNDSLNLPDDSNPRPATRTPGTITVGALDSNNDAASFSNFGSSVDIWAPGTNLTVMPDANNPNGSLQSGTSVAAPFVSGVVAMMRAVKPSLNTFEAKTLLTNSGWRGVGKVSVGVDAFAAVLAAMGGTLPPDLAERNDTRETAAPLYPFGPNGALVPLGDLGEKEAAALSQRADVDWYRFRVNEPSAFSLELKSYPLLGPVRASLEPDDPDNRAEEDIVASFSPGVTQLSGPLAAGDYKLRIDGSMNLYNLAVTLKPAPIEPDMFEPNNSFEQATQFRLRVPGAASPSIPELFRKGPGRYSLTIHNADRDFFHVQVDPSGALPMLATIRISESDVPLDVILYDSARTVVKHLTGVRTTSFTIPSGSGSFVEVSATRPTRYTLTVQYEVDQSHLPGPLQDEVVVPLPDLGDPPFRVGDKMKHFMLDLTRDRRSLNRLVFAAANDASFNAEIVDAAGAVVMTGTRLSEGMHQSVSIETGHLEAGSYFLRLGRTKDEQPTGGASLDLERLPALSIRG